MCVCLVALPCIQLVSFSLRSCVLPIQDSSHVSLVSFLIRADGFDHFRCDKTLSLGINMASMAKVLKCSGGADHITLKAEDAGDQLTFMFESESTCMVAWLLILFDCVCGCG